MQITWSINKPVEREYLIEARVGLDERSMFTAVALHARTVLQDSCPSTVPRPGSSVALWTKQCNVHEIVHHVSIFMHPVTSVITIKVLGVTITNHLSVSDHDRACHLSVLAVSVYTKRRHKL